MKAKWIHDCGSCKYKGSMHSDRGVFDWYVCNDSVIARYGDDGPEYWSMPTDMVNNDDYLIARDTNHYRGIHSMIVLARFMLQR